MKYGNQFPMLADESCSAYAAHKNKMVKKRRMLSRMENPEQWVHRGEGEMKFLPNFREQGRCALALISDTVTPQRNPTGRAFANTSAVLLLNNEDFTPWNRISLWIYGDMPGFHNIWLSISLKNQGAHKMPQPERFVGEHGFNIETGKWTEIFWEFPSTYRDCVTEVVITRGLFGNLPETSDKTKIYIDQIELQEVEADDDEGWSVAPKRISYCHSGYPWNGEKIAFSSDPEDCCFSLYRANGERVLHKKTISKTYFGVNFNIMDFSEFQCCGSFYIQTNSSKTQTFFIGEHPYAATVEKVLNFFFCERCGFSVKNSHIACHGDCFCEHPTGKRIAVDGGWHDAGDLSQGLCNTAQSVSAMLELAEHYKNQPDIYAKILSEARWGLDWVLKTTFHDGYRGVWTTIGIWTNLKQGDFDDIVFPAYNDSFENFCASACESAGYRIFLGIDVKFAKELLETAKSDFAFGMQRIDQLDCLRCFMTKRKYPQIQVYSKGIIAAVHLYHATEEEEYLHIAVRLSKVLTDSQQLEFPNWNQPVRGFFYESPQKEHILNYYHRAHSEAPIMALCLLCEVGKEYSEYTAWEQAIQLYSEYIKNCSQYTSPYCIIPAGIYDTEDFDWEDAKICGDPGVRSQEYDAQVRAGIPLDTTHYLRIFPVWHDFRGNNGVLLSLAKSASCAAKYLHDQALMQIAQNCENWILGRNPFSKSLMYGEGYSFDPLYTAFSMDMVGEIPVGIKTFENKDVPYYPFENNCTYKEIWVHSAQEYLWVLADCI